MESGRNPFLMESEIELNRDRGMGGANTLTIGTSENVVGGPAMMMQTSD